MISHRNIIQWLPHLAVASIFFIFTFQFLELHRSGKIAGFLAIIWLFVLGSDKKNDTYSLPEKFWAFLSVIFFLSILPSYFLSEDSSKAGRELEKLCKFLVIPLSMMFILMRSKIKIDYVFVCIIIASFWLGGLTIIDIINGTSRQELLYGNDIIQGDIAIILCSLIVAFFTMQKNTVMRVVFAFAFILSLLAALNSESRGAWIALPVVVLFKLTHIFSLSNYSVKFKIYVLLVTALFITLVIMQPLVGARFSQALSNVQGYIESPSEKGFTSLGVRFELWRSAWLLFIENPFWGVGLGDSAAHFLQHDRFGFIERMLNVRSTFHNDFMQTLALRGGINAALFLILGLFLVAYFLPKKGDDELMLHCRQAGLYIVICSYIFGLSITYLTGNKGIVILTMGVTLMMHILEDRKRNLSSSHLPNR